MNLERRARLVDLCNSRMLQAAKRAAFLLKTPHLLVRSEPDFDDLQCNGAARLFLFSLIHDAHAALAQQPEDSIAADSRR